MWVFEFVSFADKQLYTLRRLAAVVLENITATFLRGFGFRFHWVGKFWKFHKRKKRKKHWCSKLQNQRGNIKQKSTIKIYLLRRGASCNLASGTNNRFGIQNFVQELGITFLWDTTKSKNISYRGRGSVLGQDETQESVNNVSCRHDMNEILLKAA